jgi:hypothetical protein
MSIKSKLNDSKRFIINIFESKIKIQKSIIKKLKN